MIRYREVIGMPVFCSQKGKKLGIVGDVIVSLEERKVKAFELEKKGFGVNSKGFLFESIENLGTDAIILKNFFCLDFLNNLGVKKPFDKGTPFNRGVICGRKVYTKTGRELGVVKDYFFDPVTGRVEGIELSDGIYEDIVQRRNILPLFGKVEFGEDNVMVGREAVEEMMSTGGGIKRKFLRNHIL
ncbi:MAG TPA: photosystem reaction center subunit H [Clostridiaceae bacterium]|nr:photosystem reaction center subunit H [Clostridiaceae bacterium]